MIKIPRIHIGHEIEAQINSLKITKSEFARRIGTSKQNVQRILERETADSGALAKYSEALNFNFFSLYDEKNSNVSQTREAGRDYVEQGNIEHTGPEYNGSVADAVLTERIKALEALVAEKERLISVLMNR